MAGRPFELIDTGGLLLATDDPLLGPAAAQAIWPSRSRAAWCWWWTGGRACFPTIRPSPRVCASSGRPVIVAVNKAGGGEDERQRVCPTGIRHVLPISAEHGHRRRRASRRRSWRACRASRCRAGRPPPAPRARGPAERGEVVAPQPPARDGARRGLGHPGDHPRLRRQPSRARGQRYLFVDTAGIRKVRLLKEAVDHVSVVQARRSMERADVAILLSTQARGLRQMDATIAGYAHEAGRGIVIAVNKWDSRRTGAEDEGRSSRTCDHFKFLAYVPIVFVSAQTGRGLTDLLRHAEQVQEAGRPGSRRASSIGSSPSRASISLPRPRRGPTPSRSSSQPRSESPRRPSSSRLNHPVGPTLLLPPIPRESAPGSVRLPGNAIVLKVQTRRPLRPSEARLSP